MADGIFFRASLSEDVSTSFSVAAYIESFVDALRAVDERLGGWWLLGNSRKDSLRRQLPTSAREIAAVLDSERAKARARGYTLSVWTGGVAKEAVTWNLECGYAADSEWPNRLVLNLPRAGSASLETIARQTQIVEAIVRVWAPRWVVACTNKLSNLIDRPPSAEFVGVITAFRRDRLHASAVSRIPADTTVTVHPEMVVVTALQHPFDVSSEQDISAVARVHDWAVAEGVVPPVKFMRPDEPR